jgi:nucleoside-diphosphate-sugar epimerase
MAGGYPVKRICIIGGKGRVGQALAREYADVDAEVVVPDRAIYQDWAREGAECAISRYFGRDQRASDSILFVTSGLLDPRLPSESLLAVNYHLPRNLLSAVLPLGMQVVTFGTVMEAMPTAANAYIDSKRRLREYVESVRDRGAATHIQIHTLYGMGSPTPFMFLGQMLAALRLGEPFRMTSGRQLREYHHVADDARAIRWLVESASTGTIALSHGRPVTLRQIADAVFEGLGKSELLKAGTLPDPAEENYETIFKPLAFSREVEFRESLSAIVDYMKANIYPGRDAEKGGN